jgi:drug/metabolite transporter (DMT)-like permease
MAQPAAHADGHALRERQGVVLCVLSAASYASVVILGKLAIEQEGADPLALLTVRFAVAAAVLWPLAARAGALRFRSRRDPLVVLGIGALLYSVQVAAVFAALERIDASLTELLVFSFPALVVVGAIALGRERASRRRIAALAIAMTGVALVLGGGGGSLHPAGTAFALAGAALAAAYILAAASVVGRMDARAIAALLCTGVALALGLAGALAGSFSPPLSAAGWGLGVALALGSTVVAITAFLAGVARLGASRASILATLEPPIACGLAFLAFGERLGPLQLAGGALVVSAAAVLQWRPVRSRGRGASAGPTDPPAARPLARLAAAGRRLGLRAQVGRLPRPRLRRRKPRRPPIARR